MLVRYPGAVLEVLIPQNQKYWALELRLRALLNRRPELAPGLECVLRNLDDWLTATHVLGFGEAIRKAAGSNAQAGREVLDKIAKYLLKGVASAERPLLSKSLFEFLFYVFRFESRLERPQLMKRLARTIKNQGSDELLRQFASLHLFNVIWFETAESFRALSPSQNAFIKEMENVERLCRQMVDTVWQSEKMGRPLTRASARAFVAGIERQLWEP